MPSLYTASIVWCIAFAITYGIMQQLQKPTITFPTLSSSHPRAVIYHHTWGTSQFLCHHTHLCVHTVSITVKNPAYSILLIHAIGDYHAQFYKLVNILQNTVHDEYPYPFNIYGMDLRGHGNSSGIHGRFTIKEWREDIQLVVTRIKQDYPHVPLIVIGADMGGGTMALDSLRISEVDMTISINLNLLFFCHDVDIFMTKASKLLSSLQFTLHHLFSHYFSTLYSQWYLPTCYFAKPQFVYNTQTATGRQLYESKQHDPLVLHSYHVSSYLSFYFHGASSTCEQSFQQSLPTNKPLLLIGGELDHVQSPLSLFKTYEALKNRTSLASLYTMPHASHDLIAHHTEAFIEIIQSFIDHHLHLSDTAPAANHDAAATLLTSPKFRSPSPAPASVVWQPDTHLPPSVL